MRGGIGRIGIESATAVTDWRASRRKPDVDPDHHVGLTPRRSPTIDFESEVAVTVQMELKRIIINEIHDQQVIMLREVDGDRSFPIVIGIFEATSIDRRVRGQQSPRPLTHDLIASAIEQLGGDFQDVFISELREHTYYAKLRIRTDGEVVEVDCRPSDAIALA